MTVQTLLLRRWPSRSSIPLALIFACATSHADTPRPHGPKPATQLEIDVLKNELSVVKISPVQPPTDLTRPYRVVNIAANSLSGFIGEKRDLEAIAIADLLNCLDDKRQSVRANCLYALYAIVRSLKSSAASKIIPLLHDPDAAIAYWSMKALSRVYIDVELAPQLMMFSEREENFQIRLDVVDLLKNQSSGPCISLRTPLKSRERRTKLWAAKWIETLECTDDEVRPELDKMATEGDAEFSTAAHKAIESIEKRKAIDEATAGDGID